MWGLIVVVLHGTLCAFVGLLIGYKVGKRGSNARETALRKDRDHWHALWTATNNEKTTLQDEINLVHAMRVHARRISAYAEENNDAS